MQCNPFRLDAMNVMDEGIFLCEGDQEEEGDHSVSPTKPTVSPLPSLPTPTA
jgi:hypothetical protein